MIDGVGVVGGGGLVLGDGVVCFEVFEVVGFGKVEIQGGEGVVEFIVVEVVFFFYVYEVEFFGVLYVSVFFFI